MTGATLLLGPEMLSHILTNATASKWLTTGIKLGQGSAAGTRALSQLAAWSMQPAGEGE